MVTSNTFRSFLFALCVCTSGAWAQSQKYFVRFTDKNGSPFALDRPGEFLSPAAVNRRHVYGIPFDDSDKPVNPEYIRRVAEVPHTIVRYATKWLNGVVVSFDQATNELAALAAIDALPFVDSRSKVRRVRSGTAPADSLSRGFKTAGVSSWSDSEYGGSYGQNKQMNLICLHEKGYRGEGMVIAVLDAGFALVPHTHAFDQMRAEGRLLGSRDFVNGAPDAYVGGDHGTLVLSCMAAEIPGKAVGSAPKAAYWLLRTEEGAAETISEEYNWIRGAEFADSVGADILTTSLGYTDFDDRSTSHTYATLNGRTAPMSIASTMAARKGMFVLNAAGNEGNSTWHYISVPGDAEDICTVGAVDSNGVLAAFSSVGPTADGRIKPDLVARGAGAWVCQHDAGSGTDVCYPGSGTSFATPVLAGAVACYWQANRHLNSIKLLHRLRSTANKAGHPDNNYGWGMPNLCHVDADAVTAYATPSGVDVTVLENSTAPVKIDLCDMLGKVIYHAEFSNSYEAFLHTPSIAAGLYVLRLTIDGQPTTSKKILKLDL